MHVHQQAEEEGDADADPARLVHVPEHQDEGQEVGHRRHPPERHDVEQEGDRERRPDEERADRQQQRVVAPRHDHLRPPFLAPGLLAARALRRRRLRPRRQPRAGRLEDEDVADAVRLRRRHQDDAGEAGIDLAVDLGHRRDLEPGRIDAVDARRRQDVADLDVGVAGHEAHLEQADAAAAAAEGGAPHLGAAVQHRDRGVAVGQQGDFGRLQVDPRHLAEHAGLVDHRRAEDDVVGDAAVDDHLARVRVGRLVEDLGRLRADVEASAAARAGRAGARSPGSAARRAGRAPRGAPARCAPPARRRRPGPARRGSRGRRRSTSTGISSARCSG